MPDEEAPKPTRAAKPRVRRVRAGSLEETVGYLKSNSEFHHAKLAQHDEDIREIRADSRAMKDLMEGLAGTVNSVANNLTNKMANDLKYRAEREQHEQKLQTSVDKVLTQNNERAEREQEQAESIIRHSKRLTRWVKGIAAALMVVLSLTGLLVVHLTDGTAQIVAWWVFGFLVFVEAVLVLIGAIKES